MAKTGGFAAKKPKTSKVLSAYLAEKNIEDNDHRRQLLIKQALDNNQKVTKDRRKSANAGSKP